MRIIFLLLMGALLSACSNQAETASNFGPISPESSFSLNNIFGGSSDKTKRTAKGSKLAACVNKKISSTKPTTLLGGLFGQISAEGISKTVTVGPEILTAYVTTLFKAHKDDPSKVRANIISHRKIDKTCFDRQIAYWSLEKKQDVQPTSASGPSPLLTGVEAAEQYKRSQDLLMQLYDKLVIYISDSNVNVVSERIARDYVPTLIELF